MVILRMLKDMIRWKVRDDYLHSLGTSTTLLTRWLWAYLHDFLGNPIGEEALNWLLHSLSLYFKNIYSPTTSSFWKLFHSQYDLFMFTPLWFYNSQLFTSNLEYFLWYILNFHPLLVAEAYGIIGISQVVLLYLLMRVSLPWDLCFAKLSRTSEERGTQSSHEAAEGRIKKKGTDGKGREETRCMLWEK